MEFLAIVVGLVIVTVIITGGSFKRLAAIPVVSAWVLVLALAIQFALQFVPMDRARYDDVGIGLLMFSYALLLGFCLVNLSVRGMGVVAVGVACNALVIGLNLGMPVKVYEGGRADTTATQQPAKDSDLVQFLGDIIVLPHPPLDGSISYGDLILSVGLLDLAFWASRKRRVETAADDAEDDATAGEPALVAAPAAAALAAALAAGPADWAPPQSAPIDPFTYVGQPPVVEPDSEPEASVRVIAPIPPWHESAPVPVAEPAGAAPAPASVAQPDIWAPPTGPPIGAAPVVVAATAVAVPEPVPEPAPVVVDAVPVDVPTRELPMPVPVEAVMVDMAMPGPVPEKVKQPVWDPHRTAPVPTINAAPAHAAPPSAPDAEVPATVAPVAADDAGVRTLWSAENGDAPATAAAPAAAGEPEGRRRRPTRRRRGTPPPAADDSQHTQEIDLSAFEVRSDAGARRTR